MSKISRLQNIWHSDNSCTRFCANFVNLAGVLKKYLILQLLVFNFEPIREARHKF
jgi:hypothetical protein